MHFSCNTVYGICSQKNSVSARTVKQRNYIKFKKKNGKHVKVILTWRPFHKIIQRTKLLLNGMAKKARLKVTKSQTIFNPDQDHRIESFVAIADAAFCNDSDKNGQKHL